jgi:methionine-rich copper-binding protein CopC
LDAFADLALRACVVNAPKENSVIYTLPCNSKGVTQLTGIETLTDLRYYLYLDHNEITSLAGIRFPDGLQWLDLHHNQITSLAGATFGSGLQTLTVDEVLQSHLGEATFLGRTRVCTFDTYLHPCVEYGPSAPVVAVSGVGVSPGSTAVVVGGTVRLSATVSPGNATDKTVTWVSSNTAVARVDANGVVTGVGVGVATITVTTKSGGKTARATITVTAPPRSGDDDSGPGNPDPSPTPGDPSPGPAPDQPNPAQPDPGPGADATNVVAVTGIVLSTGTATVTVGATAALTAVLVPAGASGGPVVWVSSNPGVASVGADGVVRGVKPGTAAIVATYGQFSASATVTVTKAKAKVQAKVPASGMGGAKVTVKVTVAAGGGGKLGGKVKVTLVKGKIKVSKTVTLKAKNNAKYVTVPLPKVTQAGKYKLTITYLGTANQAQTTITKKITIK